MNNGQYQQNKQFQQQQLVIPKQYQVEAEEQKFEVYQDLQYTTNLFYSLAGALEYFYDSPNHPMITTTMNKLIAQLNISNTIHSHQQYNNQQNEQLKQNQKRLNSKALQIFNELISTQNCKGFHEYIEFFQNNLANSSVQRSLPQITTNREVQFNQDVVARVIGAMNSTDNKYKSIRKGQSFQSPNRAQVQQIAQDYKILTLQQLKINFPKGQQQPSKIQQPNNQKGYNFVFETQKTIQQSQIYRKRPY